MKHARSNKKKWKSVQDYFTR